MKKKIYIAGPYTNGDVVINVIEAIRAAEMIINDGFDVYIPHLAHFWHLISPHEHEFWMRRDFVWLKECDGLYRIEGKSTGADREIELMKQLMRPIFYKREDYLKLWKSDESL